MIDTSRMMNIAEVAKSLGISRRILLNYEEKGMLIPDARGDNNDIRYYTADTITRIRSIRIFQNLGLSLDEIKMYFDDETDLHPLIERLEFMRDELNLNIEKLKERVKRVNSLEIETVALSAQVVYKRTMRANTIEDRKEHLREVIPAAIRQYGTDTAKRMYFIEHHLDDVNLITYYVSVPPESKGEYIYHIPEEQALCIFYHGAYENLPQVKEKIIDYANENQIKLKNICRHIFLEGPPQHTDPKKFITQVAIPIEQADV